MFPTTFVTTNSISYFISSSTFKHFVWVIFMNIMEVLKNVSVRCFPYMKWGLPQHSRKTMIMKRFVLQFKSSLRSLVESVGLVIFAINFRAELLLLQWNLSPYRMDDIPQISDAPLPWFLLSFIVCGDIYWNLAKKSINFICIVVFETWCGSTVLRLRFFRPKR